jgi:pilus assembly protein CpaC
VDVKVLGPREIQLLAKKIGNTNVVIWSPKNSPKAAISVTVDTPYTHVQTQLRDLLNSDEISVEGAGESLILRGSVPNELAVSQALTISHAYTDDVINLLQIGGEHQVMLEVTIAEMSRTVGRRLGANWSAFSDGGSVEIMSFLSNLSTLDSVITTAQTFVLSDNVNLVTSFATGGWIFDIFLDLLEQKGLGKVLAEPTLVARSGESASFLSGGEIPIVVPQGDNSSPTVEYKDFGIGLTFEPTVLDEERISIKVSTEASEIDAALGLTQRGLNVPAFTTRRASTTIELADGHSFAIAGLIKENVTTTVNQYPWLGELPIVGAAFRGSEFQKTETELVILVIPRLAKPIAPGIQMPLPTDHYIEPSAWEFYTFGALEGRFWDRSDVDDQEQEGYATSESLHSTPEAGGLMGGSGLRVRGEIIDENVPASLALTDQNAGGANSNDSTNEKETSPWDF